MEGERSTKGADALKVESRRTGRLQLRWEDRVKRNFGRLGREKESEGWGMVEGGEDSNETGSVTDVNNKMDQYRCQPHSGLQRQR